MIVHQTEEIPGSNCGHLEDGWNEKPELKKEKKNMDNLVEYYPRELRASLLASALDSGQSLWEKAEYQNRA